MYSRSLNDKRKRALKNSPNLVPYLTIIMQDYIHQFPTNLEIIINSNENNKFEQ